MLQTRFLPGQVKRLRENLPHTHLQLTVHPQHYDAARVDPDDLKRLLWESARDGGFRNVHFFIFAVVHQRQNLDRLDANILALEEIMPEIQAESETAVLT